MNQTEPKITVITATYNSSVTIRETLESVANQTYSNIEHLVIDGASTDDTCEIVRAYPSVSQVHSEVDCGIYDAFNKGLQLASGEWVIFVNGDDYLAGPDVLSSIGLHAAESSAGVLLGDVVIFKEDGTSRPVVRYYDSNRFYPERFAYGWMPAHPGMVVRKSVFDRIGGFDIAYRIAGDFDWAARALARDKVAYDRIDNVLVMMRAGGVSTAGLGSTLKILRETRAACTANAIPTNFVKLSTRYVTKLTQFIRRPDKFADNDASIWW